MSDILIRRLSTHEELVKLEELQEQVWSRSSVIPSHMTLTLAKAGGLFLGAFAGEEMIGFLYSFPGYRDGELSLCSHMLGFLPPYRKQGLGVRMKWLQRKEAMAMGHHLVTWTYDPLETVNAYLNISKLGGIVRRYIPNCYGEMRDEMNAGLPTDRFWVEWWLNSERVKQKESGTLQTVSAVDASPVLEVDWHTPELPVPKDIHLAHDAPNLAVAVPANFQSVKRLDFEIAKAWREATGELFPRFFAQGYVVVDVIRDPSVPLVRYILQKGVDLT